MKTTATVALARSNPVQTLEVSRRRAPPVRRPPARADAFQAGPMVKSIMGGERRTVVTAPVTFVLGSEASGQGTARLTLPRSAFLEDPRMLTGLRLGDPWTTGTPKFTVDGDVVHIDVPAASGPAWSSIAPTFEARYADGRSELLVVKSDTLTLDDTALERRSLEQSIESMQSVIAVDAAQLESLTNGPRPKLQAEVELEQASADLKAAVEAREAARPALLARIRTAPSLDLLRMAFGDRSLEGLNRELIDAHNAALGGEPTKVAAEQRAAASMRAALVGSDDRLSHAEWAEAGPFRTAHLHAKTEERIVGAMQTRLVSERVSAEARRTQGIADFTRMLGEDRKSLAGYEQRLANLGTVTRTVPVKQVVP